MKKLLFLGNDGNLIKEILKLKDVEFIGVVADKVSNVQRRYFGSSYLIAKKNKVPIIAQKEFNQNYRRYLDNIFGNPDIMFIQGYRYKIKKDLSDDRKIKIVNFHQSLLPAYGGRHSLNWAIIRGESKTGITFHLVNGNFDEGDIILQKEIGISGRDNVISLYKKTIQCALGCIDRVFNLIHDNSYTPVKQDLSKKSYFSPRRPEDGEIFKSDTIRQIRDKVRALLYPYPGAFVYLNGKKIVIDGVKKIRDDRNYTKIGFIGRDGRNIILRCRDGILKVVKIGK